MSNMVVQNSIRPGVRFLSKAGAFSLIDNANGMVAATGEYATSYAINIANTSNDVQGGNSNALLMRTYSAKIVTITLTIRDWSLEYLAMSQGSLLRYVQSDRYKIEIPANVDADGKVTLGVDEELPVAIGTISVKLPDGTRINAVADVNNVIDLSPYNVPESCVNLTYAFNAIGREFDILADSAPMVAHLILQGDIYDNKVGKVGFLEVSIPSFQLSPDIDITLNSDGTTSDTVLSGVALSIAGTNCRAGQAYGVIREYIMSDTAPIITELRTAPSPTILSLSPTPQTQQLTTTGSYGPAYASVSVDGVTYTSADPAIATSSATGLITAVAVGDTTVTASFTNASGTVITDIVDVTVTA